MIYHVRNKANPKDTSIVSFIFIYSIIYLRFAIPISHDFNTFIMAMVAHASKETTEKILMV